MSLKIADRGRVPPFIVMDVLREANERAAGGQSILHLEVGQPGTPAPPKALEAARSALEKSRLGYTDALGLPSLRRALAAHYRSFYGVEVPAERIAVTTGSSGAFLLAFLACFAAGDRVALAAPGYPAYKNILRALGIEPVMLPAEAADRFQPTPALLDRVEGKLDGLIVASPSNPAGTMLDEAHLTALSRYCRERGIRLISDEIYHGISYGFPSTTLAASDEQAIVVNSFSKYFSMTGWRIGWLVLPPEMVRPVECLAQNLAISVPTLSQEAALGALDSREVLDGYVADYAARRALLLAELPKAGLDRLAPADGAFYLYADVGHLTNDSEALCKRLLAETGVALAPGTDFDSERGSRTLRVSFAGPYAEMAEAARRLGRFFKSG